jgi:hypothetical protein
VENEVMRATGYRTLANLYSARAPGPVAPIEKLCWSEHPRRLADAALDLLGPEAQLVHGTPRGRRHMDGCHEALGCRAGTLDSGTSEIQRNIGAKRVLKLPTQDPTLAGRGGRCVESRRARLRSAERGHCRMRFDFDEDRALLESSSRELLERVLPDRGA